MNLYSTMSRILDCLQINPYALLQLKTLDLAFVKYGCPDLPAKDPPDNVRKDAIQAPRVKKQALAPAEPPSPPQR